VRLESLGEVESEKMRGEVGVGVLYREDDRKTT